MKIAKRILSAFLALSLTAGISLPAVYAEPVTCTMAADSTADMETVVDELREYLVNRETKFEISIPFEFIESTSDIKKMLSLAVKDTPESSPVEGDYLAWTTGASRYGYSTDIKSGCYIVNFTMSYHTTAEQEDELDVKVAEILDELNVYSVSDYEKIKAVHDYIINNVTYTFNGSELVHSAYGAGVQGKAVCQGYSLLMYRLLSELDINVRLIPGTANGGGHMWNLVELYGKCYYIDSTFDDGVMNKYAYFLKGSEDFDSYDIYTEPHIFETSDLTSSLYADYTDGDFLARFDISPTAFDPSAPVVTSPPTTTTTSTSTTTTTASTLTTQTSTSTSTTQTSTSTSTTQTSTSVSTIQTTTNPVIKTITPSVSTEYVLGDIDGNGMIDSIDASVVLRTYSELSVSQDSGLTDEQKKLADVNSDGRIDASDSSIILSYYSFLSSGGDMLFEQYILTLDK